MVVPQLPRAITQVHKEGRGMSDETNDQKMRRLVEEGLIKQLECDPNAPQTSALTAAMSWLDGKGTKKKEDDQNDIYSHEHRVAMAGHDMVPVDMEGDDAASHD